MKQFDAIIRECSEEKSSKVRHVESIPSLGELKVQTPELEHNDRRVSQLALGIGKEATHVPEIPVVQLTRKELYDQVWELSVAELARQWDIPYASLLRQIREAGIPTPPSGYWSKLRHGKPVAKAELPEPADTIVSLFSTIEAKPKCTNPATAQKELDTSAEGLMESAGDKFINNDVDSVVSEDQAGNEPNTYTSYGGQVYNIYERETLYKEIWAAPVTEIAKRYQVSDVAIHKVCKSLNIPRPPRGYWAKVRAGKPVSIKPLPKTEGQTEKMGIRTGLDVRQQNEKGILAFLSDEDRRVIFSIAAQIPVLDPNARFHPLIMAYRKVIDEWEKQQRARVAKGWKKLAATHAPALAETVSAQSQDRAFRIIDQLIRVMEPLGCSLTDTLNFVVNGETVTLSFSEFTDRIDHVPTIEENLQLLKYEEARKRNSYASKPQVRKYDYIFNGRLKVVIDNKKHFRDCQSYVLEDRLGDIMIELYEAAERTKKAREVREEEERRYQEEQRRKEEFRERYDIEVDRTFALTNMAADYDIACKIRSFIAAVETSGVSDEQTGKWVEWAKSKADWYDPIVALEDEFFGKREHKKHAEDKKLGHKSRWR